MPGAKYSLVPTELTNENNKKRFSKKTKDESYLKWNLIVPQSFERVILRGNRIIVDEIVVHGRNIFMTKKRKKKCLKITNYA